MNATEQRTHEFHRLRLAIALTAILALARTPPLAGSTTSTPQENRQFKAHWIWASVQAADPFQFVKCRKTFELDAWQKRSVRPRAQVGNNAIHYVFREGRRSFLSFNPQLVRFLRITHRGEGDLTVHGLAVTEFRFVLEPRGSFACFDEGLNRIYQAAAWTTALCTLDALMDCPHRERNAMYGIEAY